MSHCSCRNKQDPCCWCGRDNDGACDSDRPTLERRIGIDDIQTAIPWCTYHNYAAVYDRGYHHCQEQSEGHGGRDSCVISMGGPTHKWWVDDGMQIPLMVG